MRIVFMGTPQFAVESLKALVEGGYEVVGVVTMPDKAAGRGHRIQYSPVKQYALEQGLPLLQPEKLKNEDFLDALRAWKADVQVVVAFRMLPEVVWSMPPHGTFNLHASLLPQYRGAAPINWAIMNGERETGLTTFFLTHEIDTGKIILQEKLPISDTDNAGSLHDKLMLAGASLLTRTLDLIAAGEVRAYDQSEFALPDSELKIAPKLFKENCKMDLTQDVKTVHNFVRGLAPYPGAWTLLQFPGQPEESVLKVFETDCEFSVHQFPHGRLVTDAKKIAKIALKDGFLVLKSVQVPNKKRMEIGELLRGMR